MIKSIWKYEITLLKCYRMPEGAQILTIQMQADRPVLWALVEPCRKEESRFFTVYATGQVLPNDPGKYIGTFQNDGYVWHLFELIKPKVEKA